ncbi:hypothetical protein [Streptomyces viridochromogenes]|uniref:Uncharacterized protein n=1 Tax=Streptomyces viridochromogenes Tue57 TaxID=1160705 RepID=L8PQP0_STRVR|nr:hypothetical protein [Streptomyces viridochromogenes]ELS57702.1 hypothetical protein STVIR_1346 [Streptomyces viridochromogenes Tue57]
MSAAPSRGGSTGHAIDTLAEIFAAVEHCRYAWPALYDPALPPVGETRDAVNLYRGRLATMGAAGAAQLLTHVGRRGAALRATGE